MVEYLWGRGRDWGVIAQMKLKIIVGVFYLRVLKAENLRKIKK